MVHIDDGRFDVAREVALVALAEAAFAEDRNAASVACRALAEVADEEIERDDARRWSEAAVAEAMAGDGSMLLEQTVLHAFALGRNGEYDAAAATARRALELDEAGPLHLGAGWRAAVERITDRFGEDEE